MGRLKNSPAYERHFQELREQDNYDQLYQESLYLQRQEELKKAEKKMSDSEIRLGSELQVQLKRRTEGK